MNILGWLVGSDYSTDGSGPQNLAVKPDHQAQKEQQQAESAQNQEKDKTVVTTGNRNKVKILPQTPPPLTPSSSHMQQKSHYQYELQQQRREHIRNQNKNYGLKTENDNNNNNNIDSDKWDNHKSSLKKRNDYKYYDSHCLECQRKFSTFIRPFLCEICDNSYCSNCSKQFIIEKSKTEIKNGNNNNNSNENDKKETKNGKEKDDIMRICLPCQSKLSQGYSMKQIKKIQQNQTKQLKKQHLSLRLKQNLKQGHSYCNIQNNPNIIYNNKAPNNNIQPNSMISNNTNNVINNNNNIQLCHGKPNRSQSMDNYSHNHAIKYRNNCQTNTNENEDSTYSTGTASDASCSGGSSISPNKKQNISSVWGFKTFKSLFSMHNDDSINIFKNHHNNNNNNNNDNDNDNSNDDNKSINSKTINTMRDEQASSSETQGQKQTQGHATDELSKAMSGDTQKQSNKQQKHKQKNHKKKKSSNHSHSNNKDVKNENHLRNLALQVPLFPETAVSHAIIQQQHQSLLFNPNIFNINNEKLTNGSPSSLSKSENSTSVTTPAYSPYGIPKSAKSAKSAKSNNGSNNNNNNSNAHNNNNNGHSNENKNEVNHDISVSNSYDYQQHPGDMIYGSSGYGIGGMYTTKGASHPLARLNLPKPISVFDLSLMKQNSSNHKQNDNSNQNNEKNKNTENQEMGGGIGGVIMGNANNNNNNNNSSIIQNGNHGDGTCDFTNEFSLNLSINRSICQHYKTNLVTMALCRCFENILTVNSNNNSKTSINSDTINTDNNTNNNNNNAQQNVKGNHNKNKKNRNNSNKASNNTMERETTPQGYNCVFIQLNHKKFYKLRIDMLFNLKAILNHKNLNQIASRENSETISHEQQRMEIGREMAQVTEADNESNDGDGGSESNVNDTNNSNCNTPENSNENVKSNENDKMNKIGNNNNKNNNEIENSPNERENSRNSRNSEMKTERRLMYINFCLYSKDDKMWTGGDMAEVLCLDNKNLNTFVLPQFSIKCTQPQLRKKVSLVGSFAWSLTDSQNDASKQQSKSNDSSNNNTKKKKMIVAKNSSIESRMLNILSLASCHETISELMSQLYNKRNQILNSYENVIEQRNRSASNSVSINTSQQNLNKNEFGGSSKLQDIVFENGSDSVYNNNSNNNNQSIMTGQSQQDIDRETQEKQKKLERGMLEAEIERIDLIIYTMQRAIYKYPQLNDSENLYHLSLINQSNNMKNSNNHNNNNNNNREALSADHALDVMSQDFSDMTVSICSSEMLSNYELTNMRQDLQLKNENKAQWKPIITNEIIKEEQETQNEIENIKTTKSEEIVSVTNKDKKQIENENNNNNNNNKINNDNNDSKMTELSNLSHVIPVCFACHRCLGSIVLLESISKA